MLEKIRSELEWLVKPRDEKIRLLHAPHVPGFAKLIHGLEQPDVAIAVGGTASILTRETRIYAANNGLSFPKVLEFDRNMSHAFYYEDRADPIKFLMDYFIQIKLNLPPDALINFIDDYSRRFRKQVVIDSALALNKSVDWRFKHLVMVAGAEAPSNRIHSLLKDKNLADLLDKIANPGRAPGF